MPFNEDVVKVLEKVEDAELRASILNGVEQAHALDVGALKENKETILKEKKELKDKYDDLTKTVEGFGGRTPEQIAKLEKDIEDLRANPGDETKLTQIKGEYEIKLNQSKAEKEALVAAKEEELLAANKRIMDLDGEINQGLSQQALVENLERIGVKAELKPILKDALANSVSVELNAEGVREVKFKHAGINFGIKDGLEAWAGATENKPYIGAIQNRGAGANGSGGQGSGMDKPFKDMSYAEKMAFYKRDPSAYKQAEANSKQ